MRTYPPGVGMPEAASRRDLIVAIDGPSGAGKSTAARSLAQRLGYLYIDTGAMYRAVALKSQEEQDALPDDEEALCRWASSFHLAFVARKGQVRLLCNGEDLTDAIRSPKISLLASALSMRRGIREALVRLQREMGRQGGVVLEGRDIGTVVFPDADVKFYLDADVRERARRRFKELATKDREAGFEETLREVIERDHNDQSRDLSPLRKAEDAVIIDSTDRTSEEVVEEMFRIVTGRAVK